jgi:hypothetical protein
VVFKDNPDRANLQRLSHIPINITLVEVYMEKLALFASSGEGFPFLDEMSGHPSMRRYLNDGYRIIVF